MTLSTANVPIRQRQLLLTNNSTEGDFSTPADLATAPVAVDESGDTSANYAVIANPGSAVLDLEFFGTDGATEIFNVRVYGYHKYKDGDYTPHLLADLICTLGTMTGRSGGIGTSNLYVHTITAGALGTRSNVAIFSPGTNNKASVRIGLTGEPYLRIEFDLNTAASANGSYVLT